MHKKGLTGFFSRRATPTSILIDNASNFTADEMQQYICSRNITWNFNPPASPWWGGIYKRIVRNIWKMFQEKTLSHTILYEIVIIFNNRPLTFIYENPNDPVLAPNERFGRSLNLQVIDSKEEGNIDICSRYKNIQNLIEHFAKRWENEYLIELRELP